MQANTGDKIRHILSSECSLVAYNTCEVKVKRHLNGLAMTLIAEQFDVASHVIQMIGLDLDKLGWTLPLLLSGT